MNISLLHYVTFFCEFLFAGCCAWIYFSAVFHRKYSTKVELIAFELLLTVLFFVYMNTSVFVNGIVMIVAFVVLPFFLYDAKIKSCLFHSALFVLLFALSEMISYPIINIVLNTNFKALTSFQMILLVSSVSKILLFIVCICVAKFAVKENKLAFSMWQITLPIISIAIFMIMYYLASCTKNIEYGNLVIALFSVLLLLANIIVFVMNEKAVKMNNTIYEYSIAQKQKKLDYDYYNMLAKAYEESRISNHDLKHHLAIILVMTQQNNNKEAEKYISDLLDSDNFSATKRITGNKIFDVVIYRKSIECKEKGIEFNFKHNQVNLDFIDDVDICSIFSNLIDNAIEAAESAENKYIDFEINSLDFQKVCSVCIKNSCNNAPTVINHKLITSKSDKSLHGIGINSVIKAVEKYNGSLDYSYDKDKKEFSANISFINTLEPDSKKCKV